MVELSCIEVRMCGCPVARVEMHRQPATSGTPWIRGCQPEDRCLPTPCAPVSNHTHGPSPAAAQATSCRLSSDDDYNRSGLKPRAPPQNHVAESRQFQLRLSGAVPKLWKREGLEFGCRSRSRFALSRGGRMAPAWAVSRVWVGRAAARLRSIAAFGTRAFGRPTIPECISPVSTGGNR